MKTLLVVVRMEFTLVARSRVLLAGGVLMALIGIWEASMVRESPQAAWGTFVFTAWLTTLVLTLTAGDAIDRDRGCRIDAVIRGTPTGVAIYVWGKYLASVGALLALTLVSVAGALVADHYDTVRNPPVIFGHSQYPPLGAIPYLQAWYLLVPIPVLFGAALMLAGITAGPGGRLLAVSGALGCWLMPMFAGSWPDVLDVGAIHISQSLSSIDHLPAAGPEYGVRLIQAVRRQLPPAMSQMFIWNRGTLFCMAILLIEATMGLRVRSRRM